MVNIFSIISMVVTILVCILFPLIIILKVHSNKPFPWKIILLGMLAFIVSQPVLRIPLINYLRYNSWFYLNIVSDPIVYPLFLSITAGIFEETARFIALNYLVKNHLTWKYGVIFGASHGWAEALIMVLPVNINNFIFSMMINTSKFQDYITSYGISSDTAHQIKTSLINYPWYMFLSAGIERIFAIIFHIALTLIVIFAIKRKKKIYLLFAILYHALLNSAVIFGSSNIIIIESYLFIMAVVSLLLIIHFKYKLHQYKV